VEVATVTAGRLRATVNEEGRTRIRHRYVVSAPVAGQLRRIPFKAGAEVISNATIVAVIDPVSPVLLDARTRLLAEARRDTAVANVEKARVSHQFAASELKRFQKLFAEQTISAQERENAEMREASASRDLAAAESALRQAEADLAEFSNAAPGPDPARPPVEIRAPVSGRVLRVFEENSRVVSPGLPLLEVGAPTDLEVVIEVLSRDGAAIPPGAKIEFEQWGGGEPLDGRVRLVEPSAFTKISALGVEEQRVNVIADFVTPPEKRSSLGDNFRVEASIIMWEAEHALKVPAGALFRQGQQWSAFAIANGRAQARNVRVGRSSGTETQILEGLREGEEVILYPGNRVSNGTRVQRLTID
jgi:HlyD family secretion protein